MRPIPPIPGYELLEPLGGSRDHPYAARNAATDAPFGRSRSSTT